MPGKIVFISYSHDSDEHRQRILELAERLRHDGLDARNDQDVKGTPKQGWPRWMLDQFDEASSVLVVCTETYYRRFRGHEVPGRGKGADWEGALITQEIYDAKGQTDKFVPVALAAGQDSFIPEPLRKHTYYELTSETCYQKLYSFLLGETSFERSPLGPTKSIQKRVVQPMTFGATRETTVPSPSSGESSPPITWVHDYLRPQCFVGRDEEISRICSMLQDQDGHAAPKMIAVIAIGGVGKSCLARMAIENRAALRGFDHIIWFSFYEARTEDVGYFFTELLDAVGVDADTAHEGTDKTRELRRRLARMLESRKCLVVLDGFEVVQQTQEPESAGYGKIMAQYKELQRALTHLLNATNSKALVTTRTPMRDFENAAGFRELSLLTLPAEAGADLLVGLGVKGNRGELIYCADLCGGHPLCLTAAGKYMVRRGLPAGQIEEVTGDGRAFKGSSEGEKVRQIVEQQRKELSPEQEHFLTMLSLHPRTITEENFPVLIKGFTARPSSAVETMDEVVIPLSEFGLIDILETVSGKRAFSVHPLMKLAYSSWLQPKERMDGHRIWAEAAAVSPVTYGAASCQTLEELQPFVDATSQYLLSGDSRRAWSMFQDRGTAERLNALGYFAECFSLAREFEESINSEDREFSNKDRTFLYDRLARTSHRLGKKSESLEYRRKQVDVAMGTRDSDLISQSEDFLIKELLELGRVKEAETLKANSRRTRAFVALYKGQYRKAEVSLRKEYETAYGHSKTVAGNALGEALFRQASFEAADQILREALELARQNHFTCCQLAILGGLIELEVKWSHITRARKYQNELSALHKALALDDSEDFFLLIAEGDADLVLSTSVLEIEDEAEDFSRQIYNLLARSAAEKATGDLSLAGRDLEEAERIMNSSGCKRLRDLAKSLRADLGISSSSPSR